MSRGDQLARQWQIMQRLLVASQGCTAAELAQAIGAHPRSVYRDLEALQTAGFPLYTRRCDGKNRWALLESATRHIPIPFSLTELMALYFCGDLLTALQDTPLYDALLSLFQKINATLPPESMQYLERFRHICTVGVKQYKPYSKCRDIINRVTQAALQRTTVRMVYYAMSRRRESRRMVDPYRLWFFNGTLYLVGYCHARHDVRIFALDRIRQLQLTDRTFTVPDDFDFDGMMRSGFGAITGKPEHVVICFDRGAAAYIQERVWHPSQKLLPQPDGSLLFEADVAVTEELHNWVLSWGAAAHALQPPNLVEALRRDITTLAARYGGTRPVS